MLVHTAFVLASLVSNSFLARPLGHAIPTMTTVTPALWLARLAHLKDVCAKAICIAWSEDAATGSALVSPWQIEFVRQKAATVESVCQ